MPKPFLYTKYICRFCKKADKNLLKSASCIRGGVKRQYWVCRTCNTEKCKRYRNTEGGKKNVYKAVYASTKRHKDKQDASMKLNYAVSIGKIKRPKTCPQCRHRKKTEGHHLDYSKPLEVLWLCRQCHFDKHREESTK